jgi:hypothetical protein
VNALIGGVVVITLIQVNRVVTRMRRRQSLSNRQFLCSYRADHSKDGRSTVTASPLPSRPLTIRLSIRGVAEPAVAAPESPGEERHAA